MSKSKVISARVPLDVYHRLAALADAQGVQLSELARALLSNTTANGNTEGIADAIASAMSSITDRIEAIESTPTEQVAQVDLSSVNRALASQERAINSLIDAVEKLQNRSGYSDPAPQNFSSQPQPAQQQNRPQAAPATNMSFTAWKMANPIREGESPAEFNARSRAEYTAAGGRL